MRPKAILILAAAIVPLQLGAALPSLTPAALDAEIASKGARGAASQLPDSDIDAIVTHVSAGDAAWLEAAARLRPGLDGAKAEGIDLALSRALTANPAGVLRALRTQHAITLPWICEDREIEASARQAAAFESKAIAALENISDRHLFADRDRCIAAIRSAGKQAPSHGRSRRRTPASS